jgi:hypothetical protein
VVIDNVGLVVDTDALLVYSAGSERVGLTMSRAAEAGQSVLVPATCLAAAYSHAVAVGVPYLDILANLPYVVVTPLEQDHCSVVGGWARTLGLDLAHAAIEAASHPIVRLMTAHRDMVTAFLPKEWPIIDV